MLFPALARGFFYKNGQPPPKAGAVDGEEKKMKTNKQENRRDYFLVEVGSVSEGTYSLELSL